MVITVLINEPIASLLLGERGLKSRYRRCSTCGRRSLLLGECGLTLKHGKYHMVRSVMEGVAFSLKDCMAVVEGTGIPCRKVIAAGGGANSPLWLQIQADILEQDIYKSATTEQACLGAAITAGVGTGIYDGFSQSCGRLVTLDQKSYHPIQRNVKIYREYYPIFRELYVNNKMMFKKINEARRRLGDET